MTSGLLAEAPLMGEVGEGDEEEDGEQSWSRVMSVSVMTTFGESDLRTRDPPPQTASCSRWWGAAHSKTHTPGFLRKVTCVM